MAIEAVQHIRRMTGGSQSHLMRCSDDNYYIVKFNNNPQHERVLANELFATKLAIELCELPAAVPEIICVDRWLIDNTRDLRFERLNGVEPCQPGLQFGSRYVADPIVCRLSDYMPREMLGHVSNLSSFAGMLVFDKWTGNTDRRQVVFWRRQRQKQYQATMIDQGACFNTGWTFSDAPFAGTYTANEVYGSISGWEDFEPWLRKLLGTQCELLVRKFAVEVPSVWYGSDPQAMEILVEKLLQRRYIVRDLIDAFRKSARMPFPNWRKGVRSKSACLAQR